MKLKFSILFLAAAFLMIPKTSLAESIQFFKSQININADSSLNVTETVVYDFGDASHHGIYRDIPYSYRARGGNYTLKITVTGVSDQNGQDYRYSVSTSGGQIDIKIGDPDHAVTGVHTYIIQYKVLGAINYFSDHDELYWNVTGSDWSVPIETSSASITLPSGALVSQLQKNCFSGVVGSTNVCDDSSYGLSATGQTNELNFSQGELMPGDGFTVVAGFPKGLVKQPGWFEKFLQTARDNWGLGLPILALIFMWFLWKAKGKDPAGFSTIVAQYEAPKDITPTEAGIIVDGKADNKDISAEIIYLATRGYLKITRLEKKVLGIFNSSDYEFEQLKDYQDLPNDFEKKMMSGLFGINKIVTLSSLKNHFFVDLKKIRDAAYLAVVSKGYFTQNPNTVRGIYIAVAAGLMLVAVFVGSATQNIFTLIGFIVSAFIVGIFGFFMPKHTAKGAEAKQYILGLKLYLSVAEKDRLKFFNAPEKSPKVFEKLLPYAMALGVEKQWAAQFEGIYNQAPGWYHDSYGGNFNSLIFISSLNNFSHSASTTFASKPGGASGGGSGFGGGGFSGGGFGGGGGGSW